MHANLVQVVRERMRSQSTEQLLELWVTNDRATWSPETFEAVKQILAERGRTELPAQNDPAPVGKRWLPTDHPQANYWMTWLRPVLWLVISLAIFSLIRAPVTVGAYVQALAYPAGSRWTALELMPSLATDVLLPGCLVVGAVGTLRLRPWGRVLLLLYAPAVFVLSSWSAAVQVWQMSDPERGPWWNSLIVAHRLESILRTIALPMILVLLLRRPEIRALFVPPPGGFHVGRTAADFGISGPGQLPS